MIRQAISCDICGAEKRQTNHWFVAYDQNGELRVSGWSARNRLRPGTKHLCGQTCLHKLVDEYIARMASSRLPAAESDEAPMVLPKAMADASLTSDFAFDDEGSSARLITPVALPIAKPPVAETACAPPVEMQPAAPVILPLTPAAGSYQGNGARHWRAEAWQRERERESRTQDRQTENAIRRRVI